MDLAPSAAFTPPLDLGDLPEIETSDLRAHLAQASESEVTEYLGRLRELTHGATSIRHVLIIPAMQDLFDVLIAIDVQGRPASLQDARWQAIFSVMRHVKALGQSSMACDMLESIENGAQDEIAIIRRCQFELSTIHLDDLAIDSLDIIDALEASAMHARTTNDPFLVVASDTRTIGYIARLGLHQLAVELATDTLRLNSATARESLAVAAMQLRVCAFALTSCHWLRTDAQADYFLTEGALRLPYLINGDDFESFAEAIGSFEFARATYLVMHGQTPLAKRFLKASEAALPAFDAEVRVPRPDAAAESEGFDSIYAPRFVRWRALAKALCDMSSDNEISALNARGLVPQCNGVKGRHGKGLQ
jgi:hypothetical protein